MDEEIVRMAAEVAAGLARRGLAACTVTLKVRYADFTTLTRSRTFAFPVHDAGADRRLRPRPPAQDRGAARPVRLLGVTASNLVQGRWCSSGCLRTWHSLLNMRARGAAPRTQTPSKRLWLSLTVEDSMLKWALIFLVSP